MLQNISESLIEVSDGSCTPTARAHQIAQYSKYLKYHNFTTMDSLEAALEALSLQLKPNYTQTAKEYNVNRSTLSRRHRQVMILKFYSIKHGHRWVPPDENFDPRL